MFNMLRLDGRIALVTGGSKGLGKAIALGLASAGARVIVAARGADALEQTVQDIELRGGNADHRVLDVTDEAAAKDTVRSIEAAHRRIDILVNNAGAVHRQAVPDSATDDFRHVVETNLVSLYVLARECARGMAERKRGRIINIGSIMSQIARPNIVSYVSTKHAVAGLTRALAVEFGPLGITCNGIGPGYFGTEFNAPLMADAEFTAMVEGRTPLARWGRPEEIAGAAIFLASDAASYVNGHMLMVDGGLTIKL
ncbi:MAG: SDR family oxidoreductase [Pseudomonadota bacterium]|nr:SDR family oxidoreductase [Pseudomonadota bacterium]